MTLVATKIEKKKNNAHTTHTIRKSFRKSVRQHNANTPSSPLHNMAKLDINMIDELETNADTDEGPSVPHSMITRFELESQCIMPATYNSDGCYICYLCNQVGLTEEQMVEHVMHDAAHSQRTRSSRQALCQQWQHRITQLPSAKERQHVQKCLDAFLEDNNMDMDCIRERYDAAMEQLGQYELREGSALLELAIWKHAVERDPCADRVDARIRSGVGVVLGNVVPFCTEINEC